MRYKSLNYDIWDIKINTDKTPIEYTKKPVKINQSNENDKPNKPTLLQKFNSARVEWFIYESFIQNFLA